MIVNHTHKERYSLRVPQFEKRLANRGEFRTKSNDVDILNFVLKEI